MRVAPAWTLGILAGGFSRRFGSDKASVSFNGSTLLQHMASRMAPQGVPVMVATRPDGPGRDCGHPWVADLIPGEGPLSGTAALLEACETPFLLVTPCDMPVLPPDLGDRMLSFVPGVDGVLATTSERTWPLPAFLSVDSAPVFRSLLKRGKRRADAWLDELPAALVPFRDLCPEVSAEQAFMNITAPEDLPRASALLRSAPLSVDPESGPC